MTGFFEVEYNRTIQGVQVSLVMPHNFVNVPIGPNSAVLLFATYITDAGKRYHAIHRSSQTFSKDNFRCVRDKLQPRKKSGTYESSFSRGLVEMGHGSQKVVRVELNLAGIYDMNDIYNVTKDVLTEIEDEIETLVLKPNNYFMRSKHSKIGI